MTTRPAHARTPFAAFLLAWLPAAALAFHMKWTILSRSGGGFDLLHHLLGQVPMLTRLALLREDLLVSGVIIPGVLLIALWRLTGRARAALVSIVGVGFLTVLFIELKAYWEVGTFVSARVLSAGIAGDGRMYALQYLPLGSLVKVGVAACLTMGIATVLVYLGRLRSGERATLALERASRAGVVAASLLALGLYAMPHATTPFDPSAVREAVSSFVGRERFSLAGVDFSTSTPEALLTAYRRISNAPVPNAPSPYFGKAAGHDVIFFIFETLPSACASDSLGRPALANIARLRSASFVATEHYSTYPYSRRAYFSIYSGWYPESGIQGNVDRMAAGHDSLVGPGAVQTLGSAGYRTLMFNPEDAGPLENDEILYQALGFQSLLRPAGADGWRVLERSPDALRDWRRRMDRTTLAMLEDSVSALIDRNQRYVVGFNPQLTHGPWPGVERAIDPSSACATGLPLFREVDGWLGEIIDLLARRGTLARTLIVLVGDHGLRTRREYPPFWGGSLDDITFHVPLQIYAPGVLSTPVEIPWMTSHVDIAPSVLDLVGLREGRELEQGSPLWTPALAQRRTFFFARGYLGADGMRDGDRITMVKYLFGGVSSTRWQGSLRFAADDMLQTPSSEGREAGRTLYQMAVMQDALSELLAPEKGGPLFRPAGGRAIAPR